MAISNFAFPLYMIKILKIKKNPTNIHIFIYIRSQQNNI